jgi:hypothetical protein
MKYDDAIKNFGRVVTAYHFDSKNELQGQYLGTLTDVNKITGVCKCKINILAVLLYPLDGNPLHFGHTYTFNLADLDEYTYGTPLQCFTRELYESSVQASLAYKNREKLEDYPDDQLIESYIKGGV